MARFTDYHEQVLPTSALWGEPQATTIDLVTRISAELDMGDFQSAALFVDRLLGDDRISAVWNVRANALVGFPQRFDPARDTSRGRRVADDAEALWPVMAPHAQVYAWVTWGFMLGVGIARLRWLKEDGRWTPQLDVWHPWALRYDPNDDAYFVQTREGKEVVIDPEDKNWALFTPYGYKHARSRGLFRPLSLLHIARNWTFRDRARHSEIHGKPIIQGITPGSPNLQERERFKNALANLGTETVVITPQGSEGNRWDVDLIEAMSDSHKTFSAQLDHIDAAIAICVLGQAQSTQGQPGLGTQEKAGDSVRKDIARGDAKAYDEGRREQILEPWAELNYTEGGDIAPYPVTEVDPPEDGKVIADEYSALGDAATKLAPYGADIRTMLEDRGVPMLDEDDFGEMMQAPSPAPAPTPDPELADVENPERVANRSGSARTHARTLSTRVAAQRGMNYAQRLAENARKSGADALRPSLDDLIAIVKGSKDFAEAKKRVVEKYKAMDPAALAEVVRKTQIMANLRGRLQVMETVT